MAEMIAICGGPGKGKSTSLFPNAQLGITGLPLDEMFVINVSGKSLSCKGWKKHFNTTLLPSKGGNYLQTHDPKLIKDLLSYIDVDPSMKKFKHIVVEDAQYVMGFSVMEKARSKG